MRTIWKFPLKITDSQVLSMPGFRILAVDVQAGTPCLWAMVDTETPKVDIEIRTHGTGHELPKDCNYYAHLGTYQLHDGGLVFHVFRVQSAGEIIATFVGGRL